MPFWLAILAAGGKGKALQIFDLIFKIYYLWHKSGWERITLWVISNYIDYYRVSTYY